MKSTTRKLPLRLKVMFDADQMSPLLRYKLKRRPRSSLLPEPTEGLYADTLYFEPGEEMELQVIGGGGQGFLGFTIVDCCFITRPQVLSRGPGFVTRFGLPSPFTQARGATLPLELDFHSDETSVHGGYRVVTQKWKKTLDIISAPGIWEMSFVLTVRILRDDDTQAVLRVFSFDPESEVGSGSTIKASVPQ